MLPRSVIPEESISTTITKMISPEVRAKMSPAAYAQYTKTLKDYEVRIKELMKRRIKQKGIGPYNATKKGLLPFADAARFGSHFGNAFGKPVPSMVRNATRKANAPKANASAVASLNPQPGKPSAVNATNPANATKKGLLPFADAARFGNHFGNAFGKPVPSMVRNATRKAVAPAAASVNPPAGKPSSIIVINPANKAALHVTESQLSTAVNASAKSNIPPSNLSTRASPAAPVVNQAATVVSPAPSAAATSTQPAVTSSGLPKANSNKAAVTIGKTVANPAPSPQNAALKPDSKLFAAVKAVATNSSTHTPAKNTSSKVIPAGKAVSPKPDNSKQHAWVAPVSSSSAASVAPHSADVVSPVAEAQTNVGASPPAPSNTQVPLVPTTVGSPASPPRKVAPVSPPAATALAQHNSSATASHHASHSVIKPKSADKVIEAKILAAATSAVAKTLAKTAVAKTLIAVKQKANQPHLATPTLAEQAAITQQAAVNAAVKAAVTAAVQAAVKATIAYPKPLFHASVPNKSLVPKKSPAASASTVYPPVAVARARMLPTTNQHAANHASLSAVTIPAITKSALAAAGLVPLQQTPHAETVTNLPSQQQIAAVQPQKAPPQSATITAAMRQHIFATTTVHNSRPQQMPAPVAPVVPLNIPTQQMQQAEAAKKAALTNQQQRQQQQKLPNPVVGNPDAQNAKLKAAWDQILALRNNARKNIAQAMSIAQHAVNVARTVNRMGLKKSQIPSEAALRLETKEKVKEMKMNPGLIL